MYLTENPEFPSEDPDDRGRGRTVLRPGAPAPDLAWLRRPRTRFACTFDPVPVRVLVPVRTAPSGAEVVRICKDPMGKRVAVGFTSADRLRAVFGPDQHWTVMAEACLRETIAGLGVETVVTDPRMTAPPVAPDDAGTREQPGQGGAFDDDVTANDMPRCIRHIPRNG